MNRTNQALMGALIGIALVYIVFSLIFTMMDINSAATSDDFAVRMIPFYNGAVIPTFIHDAFWSLIGLYTGLADNSVMLTIILLLVGFALVVAGCASKPTWDLRGSADDPQVYLFTHRPKGILWCLLIPWNILIAAWRMKKVPVIVPIIFIPFMLPFALMADVVLAVLFVIAWAVMTLRIKTAASKDRKMYDRETQYAVCPKCKRNFYQPKIKCACGLILSFPVPNRYGVSYHTCNKGHKIPCTNVDGGRSKLKAVCPSCEAEILTHDAKPIVLSLVGSVGSGKTTLMLSAVESMTALAKEKGVASEIASEGISISNQRKKSNVLPTKTGELDSEYFFMRSRDLPEKEIVINDISGVEFQPDKEKVLFEEYFRYNDGIIFTIDPLEILALHNSQSPTKGSKNTPTATLESFYHMYTEINGYGPSVKSTVPFAVVLTKMDDPRAKSAVGADAPIDFLRKNSHKMMIDIVQSSFENVRYFKVASLGDNNNSMEPFLWIIDENDMDLRNKLS